MKFTRVFTLIGALAFGLAVTHSYAGAGTGKSFKGPVGLQLYSLRGDFTARGVPATLDKVAAYGIKNVELYSTFNHKPAVFRKLLKKRGLTATSSHFPFNRLRDDVKGVVAEAKALGIKYAGCAWAAHQDDWDMAETKEAARVFNNVGKALAMEGIMFFYHLHGFEFQPHKKETLADVLIRECEKEYVSFQMDVLWILFPGQDPAKLLRKYPDRWKLMHVKDLKNGVATGSLKGKTDVKNNVVIGKGQVNWPEVLKAAKEVGVEQYYLEDESPWAGDQIAKSLKYLEKVKF
ncbi:MAG: sugar phosphate isomerase [Verrucomicrobiales bacterium]|nr:sugar phosphate isomerase [Verrucomicrobiales bacterium]